MELWDGMESNGMEWNGGCTVSCNEQWIKVSIGKEASMVKIAT